MNESAKITLSDDELQLVCNAGWILTKHAIIQKVYSLFGQALVRMQQSVHDLQVPLPDSILAVSPKIFRGENYRLLPYVILDYPRYFNKENTFAVRTIFWWGNEFSIHLQVAGTYKEQVVTSLLQHFDDLDAKGYWVCIHESPWEHHFEAGNYIEINKLGRSEFAAILNRELFVKIGKRLHLTRWDVAENFIVDCFTELLSMLEI